MIAAMNVNHEQDFNLHYITLPRMIRQEKSITTYAQKIWFYSIPFSMETAKKIPKSTPTYKEKRKEQKEGTNKSCKR